MTEEQALGQEFVVAGFAMNTPFGPTVARAGPLAVCHRRSDKWPGDVENTWVVSSGRLSLNPHCTVSSPSGCAPYVLHDCEFTTGPRAEDVLPHHRALVAGPWGPASTGWALGSQVEVTGSLRVFRARASLLSHGATVVLDGCTFEPDLASLSSRNVRATGVLSYRPPDVPHATGHCDLLGAAPCEGVFVLRGSAVSAPLTRP